jgi:hypothetical protein
MTEESVNTATPPSAPVVAFPGRRYEKGEPDPLSDKIGKIYIRTDRFMIYTADPTARDFGRLRYILFPSEYDECKALRGNLSPVAGPIASITDIICGLAPGWFAGKHRREGYEVLVERCLALMAKAMQLGLEGSSDRALEMLATLRAEIEARRDSENRMRYIFANFAALTGIVIGWTLLRWLAGSEDGIIVALFTGNLAATAAAPSLSYLDVLLFGALGAFFSVSIGLKDVRVSHAISLAEMLYAGFVRIPIGVIAAAVVILLISGGWILGAVAPDLRPWAFYLFGFLAGFSELFVPNALKQVETGARVDVSLAAPARAEVRTSSL